MRDHADEGRLPVNEETDDLAERRLRRIAEEEGLDHAAAAKLVRHIIGHVPREEQEEYLRFAIRSTDPQAPIIRGHDDRFGTASSGVEPPDIRPRGRGIVDRP
jgi:hypothetical protein